MFILSDDSETAGVSRLSVIPLCVKYIRQYPDNQENYDFNNYIINDYNRLTPLNVDYSDNRATPLKNMKLCLIRQKIESHLISEAVLPPYIMEAIKECMVRKQFRC